MEKTFIMLKPDAIQRRLIGKIITRLEERGLKIVAAKMLNVTKELAMEHYQEHKDKPIFEDIIDYITSAPVLALVIEGENSIKLTRKIGGATNPQEAAEQSPTSTSLGGRGLGRCQSLRGACR